jgi:hypothetical protein
VPSYFHCFWDAHLPLLLPLLPVAVDAFLVQPIV